MKKATLTDLMRREADLGIRFVRPTGSELVAKRLVTLTFGAFGSADYLSRNGGRQAGEHDWVSWVDELAERPESRWHAMHIGEAARVRTNSALMGIASAQAGAGLVLLPRPFGKLIPSLELYTDLPAFDFEADLWLVSHVDLRRSPRVAAAWDFVVNRTAEALRSARET